MPTAHRATAPRTAPDGRRPDIQGLRALCMIQVLCYHAWHVGSPVGVDAFIMISAYLMTGSFLRRAERGEIPSVVGRWAKTFARLVPALAVTVPTTVALGLFVLPRTRWAGLLLDGIAALGYWENWRLASQSADYFAQNHAGASPLQHLWSMSMQGQVFLLWPLVMGLCAVGARRFNCPVRLVVASAFATLCVLSLSWLLVAAPRDASVYFDTRARIWEFALGSTVAALAPWICVPNAVSRLIGWTALATLGLFFTVSIGHYPGPLAAVPMLAVSALLVLAPPVRRLDELSPRGLLRRPVLVRLGDMSYSVYLVHWPIFVLYLAASHRGRLALLPGITMMIVALLTARLLDRWVDRPAQVGPRAPKQLTRQLIVIASALSLALLPLELGRALIDHLQTQAEARYVVEGKKEHPGAAALDGSARPPWTVDPLPSSLGLSGQWVRGLRGPCPSALTSELAGLPAPRTACGELGGGTGDTPDIVVVGDSHAEQTILPPLERLARDRGLHARSILTGACAFGEPTHYTGSCRTRNEIVLRDLIDNPPRVLVVPSTLTLADSPDERVREGLAEVLPALAARNITVIGVRDNPRARANLFECSSERDPNAISGGCLLRQSAHLAAKDPAAALESNGSFHEIDPTDLYCRDGVCPTIIGNVVVYLDDNHLTRDYSMTMAPYLARRIARVVDG